MTNLKRGSKVQLRTSDTFDGAHGTVAEATTHEGKCGYGVDVEHRHGGPFFFSNAEVKAEGETK